jgi:hypothetical protein
VKSISINYQELHWCCPGKVALAHHCQASFWQQNLMQHIHIPKTIYIKKNRNEWNEKGNIILFSFSMNKGEVQRIDRKGCGEICINRRF